MKEFCKISLDFIRKGVNRKVYHSAARESRAHIICIIIISCCVEKLDVDVATIQHGVEGLMYLITECAKLMVYSQLCFFFIALWLVSKCIICLIIVTRCNVCTFPLLAL